MNPTISDVPKGDQSRGRALLVVEGLFVAIAAVLVILRLLVRGYVKHVLWWDDLCITLALVKCWRLPVRISLLTDEIAPGWSPGWPSGRCCALWGRQGMQSI